RENLHFDVYSLTNRAALRLLQRTQRPQKRREDMFKRRSNGSRLKNRMKDLGRYATDRLDTAKEYIEEQSTPRKIAMGFGLGLLVGGITFFVIGRRVGPTD